MKGGYFMKVMESVENYLETILILNRKNGYARAIDIARYLDFSKASVSIALKNLKRNEFIEVDEVGHIHLLPKGSEIAEDIFEKHQFLMVGLMKLGVDEKTASEDACKIEHVISDKTFAAIRKHIGSKFMGKNIKDLL